MARPRKDPHETRSERLECRLTVAEKAAVEAAAAGHGMTVTDYTYQKLARPRLAPPRPAPEAALIVALNRVGNNLNQIAHAANGGRGLPPDLPAVLADLRTVLERIAAEVDE